MFLYRLKLLVFGYLGVDVCAKGSSDQLGQYS